MKYLRFVLPAAALSIVFGFILPDYQVTTAGGMTGFMIALTLGTAFSLLFHGYKKVEPRLIRRFTSKKLRSEHVFYAGLFGVSLLSALLLFAFATFTGLLTVVGTFALLKAGFCLALVGTALVPATTQSEVQPVAAPAPVVVPAPAPAAEPTVVRVVVEHAAAIAAAPVVPTAVNPVTVPTVVQPPVVEDAPVNVQAPVVGDAATVQPSTEAKS